MIERAGVDVHSLDVVAPGAAHRLREQPAAMPLSGKVRHEPDERQFALVRLAKVELEHAGNTALLVLDRE